MQGALRVGEEHRVMNVTNLLVFTCSDIQCSPGLDSKSSGNRTSSSRESEPFPSYGVHTISSCKRIITTTNRLSISTPDQWFSFICPPEYHQPIFFQFELEFAWCHYRLIFFINLLNSF